MGRIATMTWKSGTILCIALGCGILIGCPAAPPEEQPPPREELPPDQPEVAVLDHFLCYETAPIGPGVPRAEAALRDQFGDQFVPFRAMEIDAFCDPTSKLHLDADSGGGGGAEEQPESVPIAHPDHHLTAYKGSDLAPGQAFAVVVSNQFSPSGARLRLSVDPKWLMAPTKKDLPNPHPQPAGLDHFKCHEVVDGPAPGTRVRLRDELEVDHDVAVGPAELHCNPTDKRPLPSGPPIEPADRLHPEQHLVCYRIEKPVDVVFQGSNQLGGVAVHARALRWLCVPSSKGSAEPL
jgi:hypothetical protein